MSLTGKFLRVAASAVVAATGAAALVSCATGTQRADDSAGESITFLEPNFFKTLYPPGAGFYPNGGVVNQITDRLLYQDPETLELSPWIATDMPKVNKDATVYEFDIRTDVTYSDGSKLTAQNVVNNFDLYGLGAKDRLLTVSEQINNYERGEVVDDDTVRFHFSAPSPGFLQATSSYNAGLLSDATLALDDEGFGPGSATKVVGSGPFVIESEEMGKELILKAREDYDWAPPAHPHQGRARLDSIRYALAAEQSVRSGAMVSGQADIARQIAAPEETHLKARGINIVSRGTNAMNNQLDFRFGHPLLQDKKVRQAIIHAVDRERILTILFSDTYPLATSSVAKTALGYREQKDAYTFDPERSKALLDAAGWTLNADGLREKDGKVLELTVNLAGPQPRSREVITMVQQDLAAIGIKLHLNSGDNATQDADSKDIDKIQVRHSMVGRADLDAIKSLFSVDNRDTFLNKNPNGGLYDQKLEDMLADVVSEPDEDKRADLVGDVQDYVTEQAYVLPLFEEPQVYAVQPWLKGFTPEAIGRPSFYGAYIDHSATKQSREGEK